MPDVVDYAIALTKLGYACYPVTVRMDSRGEKVPVFKTEQDGKVG